MRLQDILKNSASNSGNRNAARITVRKLEMEKGDYVELLKDLKGRDQFRFIIDCSLGNVEIFLKAVSVKKNEYFSQSHNLCFCSSF